jgi:hypothetical protein
LRVSSSRGEKTLKTRREKEERRGRKEREKRERPLASSVSELAPFSSQVYSRLNKAYIKAGDGHV